ncbi:MAG: hypothetical protein NTV49_13585 [Kiritimatiellaeota bacterium]|nr:hypothetical protein [Kiritimatiellota bacterium]
MSLYDVDLGPSPQIWDVSDTRDPINALDGKQALGSELSADYVVTDQILKYCARRFDGRAYARKRHLTPSEIFQQWLDKRAEPQSPAIIAFAGFYALERLLSSPAGGLDYWSTSRHGILSLELFLKLCDQAPPAAFTDPDYTRVWNNRFAPILDLCRTMLRKRHDAILNLCCRTDTFESRLTESGALHVQRGDEEFFYGQDASEEGIADERLKTIVKIFRWLISIQGGVDDPHSLTAKKAIPKELEDLNRYISEPPY